jgi:hypothetical protein
MDRNCMLQFTEVGAWKAAYIRKALARRRIICATVNAFLGMACVGALLVLSLWLTGSV